MRLTLFGYPLHCLRGYVTYFIAIRNLPLFPDERRLYNEREASARIPFSPVIKKFLAWRRSMCIAMLGVSGISVATLGISDIPDTVKSLWTGPEQTRRSVAQVQETIRMMSILDVKVSDGGVFPEESANTRLLLQAKKHPRRLSENKLDRSSLEQHWFPGHDQLFSTQSQKTSIADVPSGAFLGVPSGAFQRGLFETATSGNTIETTTTTSTSPLSPHDVGKGVFGTLETLGANAKVGPGVCFRRKNRRINVFCEEKRCFFFPEKIVLVNPE